MIESDQELIRRCLAGEQPAWAALIDRYAGLVQSIPRRMRLPQEICEDVTQLVFAEFARQLAGIRAEQTLAGWFGIVARRESWRARRRLAQRAGLERSLDVDVGEEQATDDDSLAAAVAVRAAVAAMPPPCRELLQMLFFEEVEPSYSDVSQRIGIAVGSIGPTRRRCLGKLASALSAYRDSV